MQLKLEITIFITVIVLASYARTTDAYCSLERMKKFAIEACEHLFLQDEAREKRSVEQNYIEPSLYSDSKKHIVSRSIYPRGGYLKLDREHYRRLSKVDVFPRYKARKLHFDKHEDTHERFKREHIERYNNIPYCCFHTCDEEFFCSF